MVTLRTTTALLAALIFPGIGLYSCTATRSRPAPPPPIPAAPLIKQPALPEPGSTPTLHILRASYYAPKFNGKRTTSGERYSPNKLTAASKTLPLGTIVKVENPKNGRSVRVRINDRGPFVKGRGLDLSRRAAQKIGITHEGVAPVKVTVQKRPRIPASSIPDTEEAAAD